MIPNQLFNHPGNFLLFEKSLRSMTRKLLSMLVFVCFFATNMSAQITSQNATVSEGTVMQVDDYIASIRANSTQRSANSQATHVKSLIQDSYAAAYVQSGNVQVFGEGNPVVLYTNLASLGSVSSATGFQKSNIEIVTLRVGNASELSSGININLLTGFPNLKYVYIISEGNAVADQIVSAVQNDNSQYAVFYKIGQPN